jgi:trimethylamine--corrinoid protein Co-methyltransferase
MKIMKHDFPLKLNAVQPLRFLSDDQLREIHSCSLEILQNVGSEVQHEGALEMLRKAGCKVVKKRAYVPANLVEWALKQAPSTVILYDRDGNPVMDISGRNAYFGTGSDCPYLYDWDTGGQHEFTTQDMINGAKICDAMPNIDFLMCLGLMYEYPVTSYEHQFAAMLRNSTKPMVVTAANRESIKNIAEMMAVIRGGMDEAINKPLIILYDEPISPLNHYYESIDKLIYCAENSLPTNYAPAVMMGGTGPMTLSGALCQCLAESLLGLVVHQLANPGAPFIFGGCVTDMDLKCMQPSYASPTSNVAYVVEQEIGRELYHLPTWGMGGATSSKCPDAHALSEATQEAYLSGLTGSNMNHDVGFMNFGRTYSFELLVMMNEVIGQLRQVFKGVDMSPEQLAMDVIKSVGPMGNYLSETHTFNHMKEMWQPDLYDRRDYDKWHDNGATTMEERAAAKVKDIIANYQPKPLTDEQEKGIQAILDAADAKAKEKK